VNPGEIYIYGDGNAHVLLLYIDHYRCLWAVTSLNWRIVIWQAAIKSIRS